MVTNEQTEKLIQYLNEIRYFMDQDNGQDWETAFQCVMAFCPEANITEYEDLWLRACVLCGLSIYKGISRHAIVQLWVEVYLQEQSRSNDN